MTLENGKVVIEKEAKGLWLLANNMPSDYTKAVDAMFESSGRLVVVGVGKSGYIGRKIASTMASIGQKSFFMHPSEACHGDLGMIDQSDVIMLISYSGESVELFPVLNYVNRIKSKTISITGNPKSRLARNADIVLCLPKIEEACFIGIPTVSSTMTLALGDALAVSLLNKRDFTVKQFKVLHPGGAIGQNLTFAHEIMHRASSMPVAEQNTLMSEVILIMNNGRLGCVGIVDENSKMVGIITDGDLRRHMSNSLLSQKAFEIMTTNPVCVKPKAFLSEVLNIMEAKKITCMFVIDDKNIPVGCIHIHDIIDRNVV
jgi:arabinose-5-phosphate isomerase